MLTHPLIPIDDDPGSRRAIEQGVALAKKLGARVTDFHAMTEFIHIGIVEELLEPPPAELPVLARAHADKPFALLQHNAELVGVRCDTITKRAAQTHEVIVAAARSVHCDPVVMASHVRRGIAKLMPGSQAQQTQDHADIPVPVVR